MADLRKQLSDYFKGMAINIEASAARYRTTLSEEHAMPSRRLLSRPVAVVSIAAMSVLVAGALTFGTIQWVGVSDVEVTGETEAPPLTADTPTLSWQPMQGAPDLNTVDHMVPKCCINVIFGSSQWTAGWGDDTGRPYTTREIPPEVGPIRSVATNDLLGIIAVPFAPPSTEPEVVAIEAELGGDWTHVPLPTDIPSPNPALIIHYVVESAAAGADGNYVVFSTAQPEVDPAAIEAIYPDLTPIVRTDLAAPCCEGESLATEIPDPLWVYTTDPGSDPTPVSLSTLGLTRDDLLTTIGVVWLFQRPVAPAPYAARTTLVIDNILPEALLIAGTSDGFVLLTHRPSGGYDTWISPKGTSWSRSESVPDDVIDLEAPNGRPLALTSTGSLLELAADGTWTTLAAPDVFELADAPAAQPISLAAGDAGIVIVGEREQVLPWSEGEPIPTAQVVWFSADGTNWSHQELTDVVGTIGAVEILVTQLQGHRPGPPLVIMALGPDQANGELITNPQWWIAESTRP